MKSGNLVIVNPVTQPDFSGNGIGTIIEKESCDPSPISKVEFPNGKIDIFLDADLVPVNMSRRYCSCDSTWTLVDDIELFNNIDYTMKLDGIKEFCPACSMWKWSYMSEKGFVAQYCYEHNETIPKKTVSQDQKVIYAYNGRRFGIYCLCNSYHMSGLTHGKDFIRIGKGFLNDYSACLCNKCFYNKWVYISAKGRAKQIRYETYQFRPSFCGCNSNIEKAVNFYEKFVEETDEQCPVCGYFKYYFIDMKGYTEHKKWKEGE